MFGVKLLSSKFATDSLYFNKKTLVYTKATQAFLHKCDFTHLNYLSKVTGEKGKHSLSEFAHNYIAPNILHLMELKYKKGEIIFS